MSTEENKAIVRRYRAAHNANDLDALDAIVAQDIISHNALPGLPPGLAGGKLAHQAFLAAFPDIRATTEDIFGEGDRIVERYVARGTNTGSFMGMAPTGKSINVGSMAIYRIANGKIVEHWGENDSTALMQQLGMLPMPGQAAG
jgi:predicted ester cyclase